MMDSIEQQSTSYCHACMLRYDFTVYVPTQKDQLLAVRKPCKMASCYVVIIPTNYIRNVYVVSRTLVTIDCVRWAVVSLRSRCDLKQDQLRVGATQTRQKKHTLILTLGPNT
jgi:hypothetical protein